MSLDRAFTIAGLAALVVSALIATGCGDDSDDSTTSTASTSTSTSAEAGAEQKIDSAVQSCTATAQGLGDAADAGLQAACTAAAANAKQALSSGSANAKQALSEAATSCTAKVAQLPAGQAQTALTQVCDAISGAAD
jgi:hypothetical protein